MAKIPHTFHHFKDLPKELQDDIWKHAIASTPSRVVNLRLNPLCGVAKPSYIDKGLLNDNASARFSSEFTSPCPIPSLLHACRDSRTLAGNRWQLAFNHPRESSSETTPSTSPKVFFDLDRDILWLERGEWQDFFDSVCSEDRHALQNLAFDVTHKNSRFPTYRSRMAQVRKELPFLRCVVLMMGKIKKGGSISEMNSSKKRVVCFVVHPEPWPSHMMRGLNAFWKVFAGVPALSSRPRTAIMPDFRCMDYFMCEKGLEDVRKAWDE